MRVILLGPGGLPDVVREAERLRPLIERHAEVVITDFTGEADLSGVEADAAIVLGGDGSILRAAHQMGARQLPVIAVNLGRLGFLADLTPDELIEVLENHDVADLQVVEHLMFECRVTRGTEVLAAEIGLNEVAVQSGPPFAMMDVDLYVDSELVTTYSCDGLIVSTPVGSTAHSLSAGGPILRKDLQAFVISPISPHTLSNRPVVDSADREYEMVISDARADTPVMLDGRVLCAVAPGDRIRVQRAGVRFQLVSAPGHSYYRTLREKLGWGGRLRKDRKQS
ncbi:MAG: NAD(+)/NADH kinase [Planctomycetota bacterium]